MHYISGLLLYLKFLQMRYLNGFSSLKLKAELIIVRQELLALTSFNVCPISRELCKLHANYRFSYALSFIYVKWEQILQTNIFEIFVLVLIRSCLMYLKL